MNSRMILSMSCENSAYSHHLMHGYNVNVIHTLPSIYIAGVQMTTACGDYASKVSMETEPTH